MIQVTELFPGIVLRTCRDSRFKQGCLSIQILREMRPEEASLNALLPAVLLRGSRVHPDLRSITRRLDELYGAAVGAQVRRVGDYQTTGLYCAFMDDRFALPGDRVMEPMFSFAEELLLKPLLDPNLETKAFLPEYVEGEKKNLIATIESERNDKQIYAMRRLLQVMCKGDSFALSRLGTAEQVAAITPQALYHHWEQILRDSPINLFYVGSGEPEQVAQALRKIFGSMERSYRAVAPQVPFYPGPGEEKVETMEVSQGKLCMGFTTPITNRDPEFAAMQVMNTILGAGMTSKLFNNVREKLSLCYSIGSAYYSTKGIVTVSAGIDFDKVEKTRQEILRQLQLCAEGNITDEEMCAAKEALYSSLRAAGDSPGSIESYYATAALSGLHMDTRQYRRAVAGVTREQVAQAASRLTLHSTYFLKGDSQ